MTRLTFSRITRLATSEGIRRQEKNRCSAGRRRFLVQGIQMWNDLPVSIRKCENIVSFKMKMKIWILQNVAV